MDTLSLQRFVLSMDLQPTEKLVGMTLALHINRKAANIRIRQETIATECGYSASTVKRAIKALIVAGVFESKRTGRATILIPLHGKNSGIVERSRVNHLIAHPRPIRKKERMPWDYELDYSTLSEEMGKREEAQYQREIDKYGTDI